jgi:hypothetical protein
MSSSETESTSSAMSDLSYEQELGDKKNLPLDSFFSASIQKVQKFTKNPPFPPKTQIINPQTLPPDLIVIKPLYADFRCSVLSISTRWQWCRCNEISNGAHVCWFMGH